MRAVISVDAQRVEKVPPVLAARAGGETRIKQVYRAAHDRLISILAPEQLFREDVMQKLGQGDDAALTYLMTAISDAMIIADRAEEASARSDVSVSRGAVRASLKPLSWNVIVTSR